MSRFNHKQQFTLFFEKYKDTVKDSRCFNVEYKTSGGLNRFITKIMNQCNFIQCEVYTPQTKYSNNPLFTVYRDVIDGYVSFKHI